MNTVTLDSMAFDSFEVADTDCLAAVEGEGFVSAVAEGFVGACTGATAAYRPATWLWNIPAVGPYLALGTEAIGIVSGAYAGAKNGWGDGAFW
ncbi:hypothetical protein [Streptococcus mutans]|uniref:hypothetical protein n=1 Tax=Streptococcus mutans TaxID=1309 RepID=UPI0002F842F2|nr:hypothetical protein [Streptococcus mutans]